MSLDKLKLDQKAQEAITRLLEQSTPTTVRLLDSILWILNDKEEGISYYELADGLKIENVKSINIFQGLTKLTIDGYAGMIDEKNIQLAEHCFEFDGRKGIIKKSKNIVPSYYITLEGTKFIKSGGYSSKSLQIKNWIGNNWYNVLTIFIGIVTIFVAYINQSEINTVQKEIERINIVNQKLQNQINSLILTAQ